MYEGFEWVTMDLTDEKQVRLSHVIAVTIILTITSLKKYMSYFRITMWKMMRLCSGSIIRFLFSIGIIASIPHVAFLNLYQGTQVSRLAQGMARWRSDYQVT